MEKKTNTGAHSDALESFLNMRKYPKSKIENLTKRFFEAGMETFPDWYDKRADNAYAVDYNTPPPESSEEEKSPPKRKRGAAAKKDQKSAASEPAAKTHKETKDKGGKKDQVSMDNIVISTRSTRARAK